MMTAPRRPGGQPLNQSGLRHGIRSAKHRARASNNYLRRKFRALLLASHPGLDPLELVLGIDLQVEMHRRRSYAAGLPPEGERARQAAALLDRLAARWERWLARNEDAKQSGDSVADFLERIRAPHREDQP
jgi:hypothetical protein